jgi:cytochrome c oxidase subunit 1
MPRIRSERPAFEAHYPHLIPRLEREAHAEKKHRGAVAQAGAAAVGSEGTQAKSSRDPDPGSN